MIKLVTVPKHACTGDARHELGDRIYRSPTKRPRRWSRSKLCPAHHHANSTDDIPWRQPKRVRTACRAVCYIPIEVYSTRIADRIGRQPSSVRTIVIAERAEIQARLRVTIVPVLRPEPCERIVRSGSGGYRQHAAERVRRVARQH